MEYKELDGSIRQGYSSETIHVNENYRDWFSTNTTTGDKFAEAEDKYRCDLMEQISADQQPTSKPNDFDYDNNDHQLAEQVDMIRRRSVVIVSSDDSHENHHYYHQNQQQQHYAHDQQQTSTSLDLGIGGTTAAGNHQNCNIIEREHMFDKVVTPSDVGKLNRLVIPKQHAEKYFPLDSSSNDQKGLLLNFEDVTGKSWRFRYSYWSSSQSYVMTKGWSRFVKDKKLDAGDVVSFQRGLGEADKHRLFIDWRRRPMITNNSLPMDALYHTQLIYRSLGRGLPPSYWNPLAVSRPPVPTGGHQLLHRPIINFQIPNQSSSSHYYSAGYNGYGGGGGNYMGHQVVNDQNGNSVQVYLTTAPEIGTMLRGRSGSGGAVGDSRAPTMQVSESTFPVVHGKKVVVVPAEASGKKLRLFGVNMDCPISSDTSTSDEYEILSSSAAIQVNSPPTSSYLNQYPSSSSMLLTSSSSTSSRMMYNSTPVSNKGKTSMSLDFEI